MSKNRLLELACLGLLFLGCDDTGTSLVQPGTGGAFSNGGAATTTAKGTTLGPIAGTGAGGTSGIAPVGTGGTTGIVGSSTGSSVVTGSSVSAMPAVGEGMITNWAKKPYLFGPWFTYGWGPATGSACTPTPAQGIKTTDQGMCISWTGCGVTGQGAAVGFKVCAAPAYPNAEGESAWFPLACTGTNADTCVPSEQAKAIGFCGGAVKGVSFAALTQTVAVAFLDDVGTNGTVLETVTVAAGETSAAFKGDGTKVAAIHFKLIDPVASGELCVANAMVLQ